MNSYDPQMAQRVWQRVQSSTAPEDPVQDLLPRIASTLNDAALCRQLLSHFRGSQASALQRIVQEKTAHAQCLKGIFRCLTGSAPDVQTVPPPLASIEAALHRCLGNTLRCATHYRQWAGAEDFSPVFSRLAQNEATLAQILLQLLGGIV